MLITKIEEVKRFFPHNTFSDIDKLKSYMENAEEVYLIKILGFPLYGKLQAYYVNRHPEQTLYEQLLNYVQRPIVQFGIYEALPALNVTINQSGGLTATDNQNNVVASKDRYTALLDSTHRQAWDSVDFLLGWLERNSKDLTDSNGEELWKQSEWFWQQTGLLIFTASEFENAGVYIEGKRRKFIQLLPSMRLMERNYIRPAIGNKQTDAIIKRKMDNALTEADKEVLPLLQSALALYTKAHDPELNRPEGTHGYNSKESVTTAISQLNMAKRIMSENKEDYPDYPPNKKPDNQVEYVKTEPGDPFFMLTAFSANDKKSP